MTRLNLLSALLFSGILLASGAPICAPARAQATQPPPPAVPVPAVDETAISGPAGQTVEGTARVVDGDEIMVGDKPVRLYGIAAPDLSATLGPDARLALDSLAGGQRVTCRALDRNEDGTAIARCLRGSDDIAEQLLAQGLAAVYRASQNPTPAERALAAAYDAAEAGARDRGIGLWMKAPAEPAPAAAPEPALPPLADLLALAGPLAGPIAGALIVALAILLAGGARRRLRQRERQAAMAAARQDARTLTAILSSEILAIRAAAEEQYQQTAGLIQDLPLPGAQLALLGLPPAKVYDANAGRLHLLPREVGVDLVQFYAQHAHVARLIGQAAALRCETLRAALKGLVDAAVQPLKQAEKVLD